MLIPGRLNIVAYRHDDLEQPFSFRTDFGDMNMTGWTAPRWQMRVKPGTSGSPILDISETPTANNSEISWGSSRLAAPQFTMIVFREDWVAVTKVVLDTDAIYYWGLHLTNPDGRVGTYLEGFVLFREGSVNG